MKVLMGTREQFKMTPEKELIERLRSVAAKFGRDSAQHLAEEVLTIYLPLWVAVHETTQRTVSYQTMRQYENVPKDLGTVDEFDLDTAIANTKDPHLIMDEWFAFDGRKPPAEYGVLFFSGWDGYPLEEKRNALLDAKKVLDRTLKPKGKGK